MTKKIMLVIVLGLAIRIILGLSTFHSDIQPFYFAGDVIAKGNLLNFYDYLGRLPLDSPVLKVYPPNLFNYPPMVYFFLGPVSYLLSLPFSRDLLHNFIFNLPSILGNIQFNFLLLALKTLYLPFDALIALLLYKLFKDPDKKFWALTLWIFNPVNLYATYMIGQFDIIPAFFVVAAIYFAVKKSRIFLSAILLGFGMAFKIYPLLFLIPLAFVKPGWIDRIKIFLIGFTPYILSMLPFLPSRGFRTNALLAGQTTKSLYATLPISGGESIVYFLAFVLFFYIVYLFSKNDLASLWKKFFILMLIFFIFTHYHLQWFVWITPFFIIDLVESRMKSWPIIFVILFSWVGLITFFDPGLSTWLFSPIFPALYGQPGVWQLIGLKIDLNTARSLLQTVFVSAAMYYIYRYFPKRIEE